jgi:hypothetical protein
MVEGRRRIALRHNHLHNGIDVPEHIASRKAQDEEALLLQVSLSEGIDACLAIEFMRRTINFNQKARR